ncbi:MAG: hypothetical protein D6744_02965, partial [Planctomycetota bacterium]
VTPDELRLTLRQTSVSVKEDLTTPEHFERWVGPIYTVRDGVVDLSKPDADQDIGDVRGYEPLAGEPPRDVVAVYGTRALKRLAGRWWTPFVRLKNRYGRTLGPEPLDEPYVEPRIAIDGSKSGQVVVAAVPRDVYTCRLTPAKREPIAAPADSSKKPSKQEDSTG